MPSLFTIPAERPFLDTLAIELLARPAEWLADARILLPSRRACLALRDTLIERSQGRPLLLPRLQPIGEVEEAALLLDPAVELDLPPAVPPLRRQLLLTRLVLAREGGATHEKAVRLAGALARFLDEVQTEGASLSGLDELAPEELALHWQKVVTFLRVLSDAWPALLAAEGALDPALRRDRLLRATAERWRQRPPPEPVLAAGVTGSVPAVAELLATIAGLPRGAVVLPGLDRELDDASWAAIGPTHPQWMLRRLLDRLGVARAEVADWPLHGEAGRAARMQLVREVMRPAATSRRWQVLPALPPDALEGLELAEAPSLAAEAGQLALRIRHALETPGKRVALVTSDRNLARRVAAELARWGIAADDSAGIPLDQTPPAGLLLLSAHALVDELAPAPLLAMLKHPLATGGLAPGQFRRLVRRLECDALRGPRPAPGFAGLRGALGDRHPELMPWLADLEAAAAPFLAHVAAGTAPFAAMLATHLAFAERLAADEHGDPHELWAREAGATLQAFVAELAAAAPALGALPVDAYPAVLAVLMGGATVRPWRPAHPRVAILGQLESRLQGADLVLIGGLVEGVWPRQPEAGPWLNRAMRERLGLPPVEQQIGIAGHDLVMALGAPEVVLSHARADAAGAPTTPSRWIVRLRAVLQVSGALDEVTAPAHWAGWAEALDAPPAVSPCPPPAPRPPFAARPRRLSVSDVEQLMRNPYGLHARKILGLRALDPVDADPGTAERGIIIHEVLERFVRATAAGLPDDPLALLMRLGAEAFARRAHQPRILTLWWPRFRSIADWFVGIERRRRADGLRILTEARGEIDLGEGFAISAKADRIEIRSDGGVSILDYKTGSVPDPGSVASGFSPQMPLEGVIAAGGGFAGVPAFTPDELLYLRLRGGEPAGEEKLAGGRAPAGPLIDAARSGVLRLLVHFADPATPFTAVPRPEVAPAYDDYEHLARIAEWRSGGGEP